MPAGSIALIALILGACGLAPSRQLDLLIPVSGSVPQLPITVVDPGALVRAAAVGGPDAGNQLDGGVTRVPGSSTAAVVWWLGGACDTRTVVSLGLRGSTVLVALTTETSSGACILVGLTRRITLDFVDPIESRTFEFSSSG
jgi:hypothetical protein